MVRANNWEGAGGILVKWGERWGKGDLVIVDIPSEMMWLMMASCKKGCCGGY